MTLNGNFTLNSVFVKLKFKIYFLHRGARSASSVLLSYVVRSSRLSETLSYRGHISWTSSKLITRIISLGHSLFGATTSANLLQGEQPKIGVQYGWGCSSLQKTSNISETAKIGPTSLLMTNRKLHARFRLVPKSPTLDDMKGPLCTLFQNTCDFRSRGIALFPCDSMAFLLFTSDHSFCWRAFKS